MKYKLNKNNITDGVQFHKKGKLIVYKNGNTIKVCHNKCKHQGNLFTKTKNSHIVKCSAHGWELDLEKMKYTKPHGIDLDQELLKSKIHDDSILVIDKKLKSNIFFKKQKQPLKNKELTITHYTHATAEINCGNFKIITDPWCEGPAFTTGWWLNQAPPIDWLQNIASSNLIYISHSHSDHLNIHTLKKIKSLNPNIEIIIPAFKNKSCDNMLRRIGLSNVKRIPFLVWQTINKDCRYMILEDFTGKNDSGILIEYKGYSLLNLVDSHNLNNGELPEVDILMGSFSGGSSGHPVCWENYNQDKIKKILSQKKKSILQKIIRMISITNPQVFVPFAGYFSELHPADLDILKLNKKNTLGDVSDLIEKKFPSVDLWKPLPNQNFDLSTFSIQDKFDQSVNDHDFENYDRLYFDNPYYDYLDTLKSVQEYFDWAHYRDDKLILHIIETDQFFNETIREFYVDFKSGKVSKTIAVNGDNHYLRIKVKSHIFRYVLAYGFGWEEISIGFQARLFRNPDVYNRGFWNHFQDKLPSIPLFKELYDL